MQAHHGRRWALALRLLTLAVMLTVAPGRGWAEPIVLKFSLFTSDGSSIYECHVKPFVDALNREGAGLITIKLFFSGAISPSEAEQPDLVASGAADLAYIVPAATPQQFPDSLVLSLGQLFRDSEEASLVFTRLIGENALQGYDRFFPVGADVTEAESVHSRKPIPTLADLKGQTLRVNNDIELNIFKSLGASPIALPLNRTMNALSEGAIDGVAATPYVLTEFGFSRVALNHYLLPLGGVPVAVVMNRAKFASLPSRAQDIIRKYSGDWFARRAASCTSAKARGAVARLRAEPRRTVIDPSPADLATVRAAYDAATREWMTASPHNLELMGKVTAAIAAVRKEAGK